MIYMEDANKEQLLQIALFEDCSLDLKYQAVRELQIRSWQDWMLPDLIKLWGLGKTIFDISIELGISKNQVKAQLFKHKLYKKRKPKEMWEWVEVAKENGISPGTFRSRYYTMGWSKKKAATYPLMRKRVKS